MYNLEKDMKKFYYNEVVLPKSEINNLREKKKINIDRLKDGLKEYNEENGTDYKIAETIEQGSVAMSTVIQNDKKDYDIDIAIVFDSSNIGDIGSIAIKNIIVNEFKAKATTSKTNNKEPINNIRPKTVDKLIKRLKNTFFTFVILINNQITAASCSESNTTPTT